MKKVIIELEIEISDTEEVGAVLNGYFKHQSHIKGRKASLIGFNMEGPFTDSVKDSIGVDKDNSDRLAKARAAKAAKKIESNNNQSE